MPSLSYIVVDAFTSEAFQGNPAAVVAGGDELSDVEMHRIAREFNLSETVFLLRPSASHRPAVRLRWFTPRCEMSFCGHATLAAVHSFCERPGNPLNEIGVECAAGDLVVRVEPAAPHGRRYWLSMPRPECHEADVSYDQVLDALGVSQDTRHVGPIFRTRDNDVVVFLETGQLVRLLSPDMAALERLSRAHNIRGVSVASVDSGEPGIACISRFFAPADGIPEDPATGSVHGPLAAILIREKRVAPSAPNHWSFVCRQVPANGRVGTVHVRGESRDEELSIEVGGSCVTVMAGQISI